MTYDELGFPLLATLEQTTADEAHADMNSTVSGTYEYELDDEGRPASCTQVEHNEAGEETSTTTMTFAYDENGNVSEVVTDVSIPANNFTSHAVRKFTRTYVEEPSKWTSLTGGGLLFKN